MLLKAIEIVVNLCSSNEIVVQPVACVPACCLCYLNTHVALVPLQKGTVEFVSKDIVVNYNGSLKTFVKV